MRLKHLAKILLEERSVIKRQEAALEGDGEEDTSANAYLLHVAVDNQATYNSEHNGNESVSGTNSPALNSLPSERNLNIDKNVGGSYEEAGQTYAANNTDHSSAVHG